MTIDRKNCVKSIVAWNHKKSWANYKAVCKHCYLNLHNTPAPIWAIYTHVKTIWNTLVGKYRKCESKWIAEGELNYYLGV